MIDSITFSIPCPASHRVLEKYKEENPTLKCRNWSSAARIPGYGTKTDAIVWPIKKGSRLAVYVSLPKFLFGHNVFGSNRLAQMCLLVCVAIEDALGRSLKISAKKIHLTRVDIGLQVMLPQSMFRPRVFNELHFALRGEGFKLSVEENEGYVQTIYVNKRSKDETLRIYDKAKHLLVENLPSTLTDIEDIVRYAENSLRFEWVIRSRRLTELGLRRASDWSTATVKQLLSERVKELQLRSKMAFQLQGPQLALRSKREQSYLRMQANGIRLRDYLDRTTYKRLRTTLLPHGVDIADVPKSLREVDFAELTAPDNLRFGFPSWAKGPYTEKLHGT